MANKVEGSTFGDGSRSSPGERVATTGGPRSDYWPAKRPPEPPPDAESESETDRKRYFPSD